MRWLLGVGIILMLPTMLVAKEVDQDAAIVRAALAATGRAACQDPDRAAGPFAALRSERARDSRREELTRFHEKLFRMWESLDEAGWLEGPIVERLAAASARLLAGPTGPETRGDTPDLDQPGPCNGLIVSGVEWMDGIAFVEVGERRGGRDGNGMLWAFEWGGTRWVPLAKQMTWVM
ncbi:hypothetical protein [Sphingomonas hankookensis]